MHVQNLTGLPTTVDGRAVEIVPTTPGMWAQRTLDAYRPLVNELATSLGQRPPGRHRRRRRRPAVRDDGRAQLDAHAGDARHGDRLDGRSARGPSLRPVRPTHPARQRGELLVVAGHDRRVRRRLEPRRSTRCGSGSACRSSTAHAVLERAHVRDHVSGLVRRHVAGFRPDPTRGHGQARVARSRRRRCDVGPAANARRPRGAAGSGPDRRSSSAQLPLLDAIVSVIVGYVDHVVDQASRRTDRLVGSHRRGGAPTSGRGVARGRLRRATLRTDAHPVAGRARSELRGRCARAGGRRRAAAAVPQRRRSPDPRRGRRARALAGPHRVPHGRRLTPNCNTRGTGPRPFTTSSPHTHGCRRSRPAAWRGTGGTVRRARHGPVAAPTASSSRQRCRGGR